MCPLLTEKQSNPILCRHDCAWYVALPPLSEFDEAREGCALSMLVQELSGTGSGVTEALLKLQQTVQQTPPARA